MIKSYFFDFPMTMSSIWTESYCLLLYLIILCRNWKSAVIYPFTIKLCVIRRNITVLFIGFALVTFCTLGDFYHLMSHLNARGFTLDATEFGVESIYGIIGKTVGSNYLLFRSIVFGGAFFLYCKTAKRFGVDSYYAAVYIYVTHVILFSYARATLAMAIYFYGLSFLCVPRQNYKACGFIFSLFLIASCKEFHSSALIMIISTLSLFFPYRKWIIISLIVLTPILIKVFESQIGNILLSNQSDDYLMSKVVRYVGREQSIGIARIVIDTFSYASFYIPLLFSTIVIFFRNKANCIPVSIFRLYKVTFSLMYVSFLFYLLGEFYFTFFYRILYMSMIPLSIIVLKLHQEGYMSRKMFVYSMIPGIPYMIIRTLYCIYLGNLGIQ